MKKKQIKKLIVAPIKLGKETVLDQFQNEEDLVFLDSYLQNSPWSNWSILAVKPLEKLIANGHNITYENEKGDIEGICCPFKKIKEILDHYDVSLSENWPFIGGFLGYIGYEASQYQKEIQKVEAISNHPQIIMGLYDQWYLFNEKTKQAWWMSWGIRDKVCVKSNKKQKKENKREKKSDQKSLDPLISKEKYIKDISRVLEYIKKGDCYQVNYTYPCQVKETYDPINLYRQLKKTSPVSYGGVMKWKGGFICSASPEEFLKIEGEKIRSRPIKGTINVDQDSFQDEKNKSILLKSKKDAAELLMITDLVRNDFARVCKKGSVKVVAQKRLESFAQVHHLSSEVQGQLEERITAVDAFLACFPGGSITGAPKKRAMEIIDELECYRRNQYTGCMGYFGLGKKAIFNIVIRTIIGSENKIVFNIGSGVVADSDPELEWKETWLKAQAMVLSLQYDPRPYCC